MYRKGYNMMTFFIQHYLVVTFSKVDFLEDAVAMDFG